EHQSPLARNRLVLANPADERPVAAGRLERVRDVHDLDAGRGLEQLTGALGGDRLVELGVDHQGVPAHHRHAHAGARDRQVRQAPSSTRLPAPATTLNAIGLTYTSGSPRSTAEPSIASSSRSSTPLRT